MKMFAFRLGCFLFCCFGCARSSKITKNTKTSSIQLTCNPTFQKTDDIVDLWAHLGRKCYSGGGVRYPFDLSGLPECVPPHTDNTPHVYVVGDSHAFVLGYGLRASSSWPTHYYSNGLSQFPSGVPGIVNQLNKSVGSRDIIIVAMNLNDGDDFDANVYKSFMQSLKPVAETKGARLVLLGDYATIPKFPQECKLTGNFKECEVSENRTTSINQAYMRAAVEQLFPRASGFGRIELLPALCGSGQCLPNVPETRTIAYSDQNHLSKSGAEYVGYYLCQHLQKL